MNRKIKYKKIGVCSSDMIDISVSGFSDIDNLLGVV